MASTPQRALLGFSSRLLQKLRTSEASPPGDELTTFVLTQQAIDIVNNDTQLAPEKKAFIIQSVLGKELASHRYLAAKSIIKTIEQGNTANTWYCRLRQGIDYLRHAGNRRRPKDKLKQRPPIQRCEVTGNDEENLVLKGCRILPFPISNEDVDNDYLWSLLRCFWDPSTVEAVKLLCDPVHINDFVNGLVMSTAAYDSFNSLDFYLVPELDTITPKKYSAIFHWTRESGRISNFWHPGSVFDGVEYFSMMESGQRIVFESVDPVLFPLPDPGLLIVRALLAKISHPPRAWIDENFGGHEPVEDDQSVSTGSSFGCIGYYSSDSCPSVGPRYECTHTPEISIATTAVGEIGGQKCECVVCIRRTYVQDWLDGVFVMATGVEINEKGTDTKFGETYPDLTGLRISRAMGDGRGIRASQTAR